MELILKAFLRLNGHTVEDMETKSRHRIHKKRKRRALLGMNLMEEDRCRHSKEPGRTSGVVTCIERSFAGPYWAFAPIVCRL